MSAENGDAARKPRNGRDDRTIELESPGEIAYWLKWLDASEPEVREAVRAVGPAAHKVRLYLLEMKKDPGPA